MAPFWNLDPLISLTRRTSTLWGDQLRRRHVLQQRGELQRMWGSPGIEGPPGWAARTRQPPASRWDQAVAARRKGGKFKRPNGPVSNGHFEAIGSSAAHLAGEAGSQRKGRAATSFQQSREQLSRCGQGQENRQSLSRLKEQLQRARACTSTARTGTQHARSLPAWRVTGSLPSLLKETRGAPAATAKLRWKPRLGGKAFPSRAVTDRPPWVWKKLRKLPALRRQTAETCRADLHLCSEQKEDPLVHKVPSNNRHALGLEKGKDVGNSQGGGRDRHSKLVQPRTNSPHREALKHSFAIQIISVEWFSTCWWPSFVISRKD